MTDLEPEWQPHFSVSLYEMSQLFNYDEINKAVDEAVRVNTVCNLHFYSPQHLLFIGQDDSFMRQASCT